MNKIKLILIAIGTAITTFFAAAFAVFYQRSAALKYENAQLKTEVKSAKNNAEVLAENAKKTADIKTEKKEAEKLTTSEKLDKIIAENNKRIGKN